MIDEKISWASWMEKNIEVLAQEGAQRIAVAAFTADGQVYTSYYMADLADKAMMATHIYADALLDVVLNNARLIVNTALEQEADDEKD